MEINKKKLLIIAGVTAIAMIIAVSTIAISFRDTSVTVADTVLEDNISEEGNALDPTFKGKVQAETEVFIYNSGILDLKDLEIYVEVFFIPDSDPTTKHLVGDKTNELGDIPAGENVSKTIEIDLTEKTSTLAVEDGKFEINLDISISVQYIPRNFEFQEQTEERWNAPFSAPAPTL